MRPEHRELREIIIAMCRVVDDLTLNACFDYADRLIAELERREAEEQKAEESKGGGELPTEGELRYTRDLQFKGGGWLEGAMHLRSVAEPIIAELRAENERLDKEWKQAHETNAALLSERTILKAENERLKAEREKVRKEGFRDGYIYHRRLSNTTFPEDDIMELMIDSAFLASRKEKKP